MPSLPEPRLLECRGRSLRLGGVPALMGILNVTPDSFSDGGRFSGFDQAVRQAEQMVAEGAAVIDIGGQSTRPGFAEVTEAEEIDRVVPVIRELITRVAVPLSIDTYKPAVARAALEAGAHLLNDVHGLQRAPELAALAAGFGAPVVAMHWDPAFRAWTGDTLAGLRAYFDRTVEIAARAGLGADRLMLDPGIGFAKTQAQNLELVRRLDELRRWGFPILLGASRKSFIGSVLAQPEPADRLEGTLATTAVAAWHGVELLRVHDVAANLRVARMTAAIRGLPL